MTDNAVHEPPVDVIQADGAADILLVCDHASRRFPLDYGNLGLAPAELDRHIAYDIGAAALTRRLSGILDAPAILARWSRLLIDVNREVDSPTLIPEISDATPIPGNQGLSEAERQRRIARFYDPFHSALDELVQRMLAQERTPLVIGVHSFTPVMAGVARPWDVGLLWNRDPRLAQAMIDAYRRRGFTVGDNEPYSGRHLFYTMDRHGAGNGLPQATLEIRQDHIGTPAGVERWATVTAEVISEIAADPELQVRRFYAEGDQP